MTARHVFMSACKRLTLHYENVHNHFTQPYPIAVRRIIYVNVHDRSLFLQVENHCRQV